MNKNLIINILKLDIWLAVFNLLLIIGKKNHIKYPIIVPF